MKDCRKCKHFANDGFWAILLSPFRRQFAKCNHSEAEYKPGDDSSGLLDRSFCSTMRLFRCGPNGKFYEAKP